jgi:hypothetical protein
MSKKFLYIALAFVIVFVIAAKYDLYRKAAYKILPVFLKYRYGINAETNNIEGGLRTGIKLKNTKILTPSGRIECSLISTDLKFFDLLVPRIRHYYNISLIEPKIYLHDFPNIGSFRVRMPLWLKTHISISDALINIKNNDQELNLGLSGEISVNRKSVKIQDLKLEMEKLEVLINGGIEKNKELNLLAHFTHSDNRFMIKGPINKPQIYTKWGNMETSFAIEGIKYLNGQLLLSNVAGNVYLEDFPPVDFNGGLFITREFIKFSNMVIFGVIKAGGVICQNKYTRLRLLMNDVEGCNLASRFPATARSFLNQHKVSTDIGIYGMANDLQGGGIIKLHSTPIEFACRYRGHRLLFRSIGEGAFNTSGSIGLDKEKSIKIKGSFKDFDIKEFIVFFGKELNNRYKGIINGKFTVSGDVTSPRIESRIELEDAKFGDTEFDIAYLNLYSTGNKQLCLRHSMVYYKEVPAELCGYIDLNGKEIFKNVEIRPSSDGFILEGINITKDSQDKVVTFEKDVNENVRVHFKSSVTSDPGEEDNVDPEIKLEYKLNKDKNLLLKMQEDEGTVGVEQKVKF